MSVAWSAIVGAGLSPGLEEDSMVNRVSGNSRERESYGRCRVTACDALDLAGNRMPIAERSAAWSRPGCGPGFLDWT